jgi:hypothetical protein
MIRTSLDCQFGFDPIGDRFPGPAWAQATRTISTQMARGDTPVTIDLFKGHGVTLNFRPQIPSFVVPGWMIPPRSPWILTIPVVRRSPRIVRPP